MENITTDVISIYVWMPIRSVIYISPFTTIIIIIIIIIHGIHGV